MVDIRGLMKKAQAMQAKMKAVQDELERIEVEGESGGGMVKVRLNAKGQMKAIALDPSLMTPADRGLARTLFSPPTPTRRARPIASRRRRCRRSPPSCRCRPA